MAFFDTYAEDHADLWKGGVPIQHSERKELWRKTWGDHWQPVTVMIKAEVRLSPSHALSRTVEEIAADACA